jgi:hypothetical protein
VKPDGLLDGHPASSKLDLFEAMVENIVGHLNAKPELMAKTAFIITFDEGGGYYDSGYIQPIDFFGDGPRIPLIVVSNFLARRSHQPHLHRSRLDPEVHRAQLAPEPADQSQPGQPSEPEVRSRQSLCSEEQPGHRRPLRPV